MELPGGCCLLAWLNSLAPGGSEWNFRYMIFKLDVLNDGWVISCEIPLRRMSLNVTDNKSTLVQVMAWCLDSTKSLPEQMLCQISSPCGVTRPQWVNSGWFHHVNIKHCVHHFRSFFFVFFWKSSCEWHVLTLEMVQVVKILLWGRQCFDYPTSLME